MNGYERALRTLRFEDTDCVATWGGWIVSASFFEYITGKNFWDNPLLVAIEAYQKLKVDIVVQSFYLPDSPKEWRRHTYEVISGSEKYHSPEDVVAYVELLPKPERTRKEFDFEKSLKSIRNAYLEFQEKLGSNIFCLPSCDASKFIWYMDFGYENFLSAIALYPEAMKKLFEYSAEIARLNNMVRIKLIKENILPPFFFTGYDICGNKGPMVSPETLRSIYFPNLRYSLEPLVEINAELIWHSDGYIIPIVDDLIECGITGFQGFQEETGFNIKDIIKKRVRLGRRPLILAGLSVDKVLPFGTVTDVKNEIERIINTIGLDGGVAIGTANTAGPDCPDENLEAIYHHTHIMVGKNCTTFRL